MSTKPAKKTKPADAARPKAPADVFKEHPAEVRELAGQLRQLIVETLPGLTEGAFGGAKVRLTLFSRGQPARTICGLQPSADGVMFYLHHIAPEDSSALKIEGKGKHARHIRLTALDSPTGEELRRLLLLANRRAG